MEMRPFVEHFLTQNKMTQYDLAQSLGYKSKTSLVRVMDGTANSKSVRDFERRMLEKYTLTTQQEKALHNAATISIHGRDVLYANQEMWRFIHGGGWDIRGGLGRTPCGSDR